MKSNHYIFLIIPIIILFIIIELIVSKKQKKKVYLFNNSIANVSIGIGERLCDLFLTASFFAVFSWVYDNLRLATIPENIYTWITLLFVTDFIWYWYHRLGHEINIFWGAHIVHHQSPDFNYTTAVRVTIMQSFIRNLFWCILPLAGFSPQMTTVILIIHGGYAFFTHTQIIGKLGFLEHIFITPSHHRVHHASNEQYIDKNYGDVFVFWDKLFGTFKKEEEAPKYGLSQPLDSYSFLWQHFHFYMELFVAFKQAKGIRGKLKILFGKPEIINPEIRLILEEQLLQRQKMPALNYRFKTYIWLQIALSLVLLTILTYRYDAATWQETTAISIFIFITLINCGAILEKRSWTHYPELMRVFWTILCFSYYLNSFSVFAVLSFAFGCLVTLLPVKTWYYNLVFKKVVLPD